MISFTDVAKVTVAALGTAAKVYETKNTQKATTQVRKENSYPDVFRHYEEYVDQRGGRYASYMEVPTRDISSIHYCRSTGDYILKYRDSEKLEGVPYIAKENDKHSGIIQYNKQKATPLKLTKVSGGFLTDALESEKEIWYGYYNGEEVHD